MMAASKAALELLLQLKGDAEAARGLKSAQQDLKGLAAHAKTATTLLKGMFTAVGGYAVVRGGLRLVAGAAREVRGAVFDMNAVLETSGLQFETLMGDADRAREHIAMLFDFAKATPFETEPLIEASRQLQNFGREALNTRETMTLIGDAAAAVSAPIDELGRWTGRLYSQLQAGRPFGEAAQRLQELAVLSPEARNEMERLQKAGADADAIWAVFTADMERFTGAMARQANTWTGLKATISDTVKLLSATAFKPLFDEARRVAKTVVGLLDSEAAERGAEGIADAIQTVIDRAKTLAKTWIARFGDMELGTVRSVGRIAGFMWGLAKTAVSWGVNVVGSLGVGIASAVGLVTKALNFLGSVIGGLLKPGSPPKLLPELDTWGQGAAEAWLAGWTQADFGALRDFAGEVQGALRALAGMGEMDEGDVTAALLGSREAFAELLQQIRETGSASAEAFRRIREAAGPAGEQAEELARRYARVAEASGRLAEVQGRLRQIAGEQQDRLDTGRLAELEAILADPRASAGQRERALAEQERIRLLMEERGLQSELDAAQGELDAYRSRLEVETATRDLLREEAELVKSIVDKVKEASGGGGDGLADELAEAAERAGAVVDAAEELQGYDLSELLAPLQEVIDEMTLGFEEGEQAAQNVGTILDGLAGHGGGIDAVREKVAALRGEFPLLEQALRALGGDEHWVFEDGRWRKVQTGWQDVMRSLSIPPTIIEGIEDLKQRTAEVGPAWAEAAREVLKALGDIGAALLATSGPGGEWTVFQGIVQDTIGGLRQLAVVARGMAGVLNGLAQSIAGLFKTLQGVATGRGSMVDAGVEMGLRGLQQITDAIVDVFRDIWADAERDVDRKIDQVRREERGYASGTGFFGGGLAWVGERGPELVSLPRGSRIWPAQQSMAMAGGGAGGSGVVVNINGDTYVRNEEDMNALVWKIVREVKRRER